MNASIPSKANKVLNFIILGLLLILIRVWVLAVLQHDDHVQAARKPQRRSVIEKVARATIRDRFNIPLAINKIQYNASVCYADIRQIPSVRFVKGADGKRTKVYARSSYIKELSDLLASELGMESQAIEDTIHGKASLFPHTPFVIKEDLSEDQYFRLKLLEKEWVGIRTEPGAIRSYPQGRTACDVIGYLGAISSKEYFDIAQEMKILQGYLNEREAGEMPVIPKGYENALQVRERLKELQEKAYTINDLVGKMGIESRFDEELRGRFGKKVHEVDIKGNFLRELPGSRQAVPGQKIQLAISSELQTFAEQLLAHHEEFRELRSRNEPLSLKEPWMRGGAIVAMDPHTGEIVAMASYPRFDPNDFIPSRAQDVKKQKHHNRLRWLENEEYIGQIWDGKRPMERERCHLKTGEFYEETLGLSWPIYLEGILPAHSPLLQSACQVQDLGTALVLQQSVQQLLLLSGQEKMSVLIAALYGEDSHLPSRMAMTDQEKFDARAALHGQGETVLEWKKIIDPYLQPIEHNDDKLLLIDLLHMLIHPEDVSEALYPWIKDHSLSTYRALSQSASVIRSELEENAREWFHEIDFQAWRSEHFKEYLKAKRKEEKEKKQYAKPYTDYLEQVERSLFKQFWETHSWNLTEATLFGKTSYSEEILPYLAKLAGITKNNPEIAQHVERLKDMLRPLPQPLARSYLRSMRSFNELRSPLYGHYRSLRNTQGIQQEKHLAAAFYPLSGYGYGRSQAFRQSTPSGSVFKVLVGYQGLLEKYQQLDPEERFKENLNPLTLIDQIQWTAHPGSPTQVFGRSLDGEIITRFHKGGRLPRSHPNVGKIDLIGALEQSSNLYFPILAAEHLGDPSHLIEACKLMGFGTRSGIELPGEIGGVLPNDLSYNKTGLYSFAIGQHTLVVTPLQTALMLSAIANKGKVLEPKIVHAFSKNERKRETDLFTSTSFPFQEPLSLIGINFPLFSAVEEEKHTMQTVLSSPHVKREICMPDEIRKPLLEGMHRVIAGPRGTARPNIIRMLYENPEMRKHYHELKSQMVGKTGTAEIMYKHSIDAKTPAVIHNHIYFSGIAFASDPADRDPYEHPELVVVVYLRLSEAGGKEAAPLGVEMVKKWREIRGRSLPK